MLSGKASPKIVFTRLYNIWLWWDYFTGAIRAMGAVFAGPQRFRHAQAWQMSGGNMTQEPEEPRAPDYTLLGPKWKNSDITWSIARQNYVEQPDSFAEFMTEDGEYAREMTQAFRQWEKAGNVQLRRVADGPTVNIRVGLDTIGPVTGAKGRTVWSATSDGSFFESGTLILFDTSQQWKPKADGRNDQLELVNKNGNVFLFSALKLAGYSMGLGDYNGAKALMNTDYNGLEMLTVHDIHGMQVLYGYGPSRVPNRRPVISGAGANVPVNSSVKLSTLGSVGDADDDSIELFQLWQTAMVTPPPNTKSGYLVVRGKPNPFYYEPPPPTPPAPYLLTPAEFEEVTFHARTPGVFDRISVRAFDGMNWSGLFEVSMNSV